MPLFRKKNSQPLPQLLNNLEKISKISALRIDKNYIDSVISDLNWLQNNFKQVLQLRETNIDYFFSLVDPHKRYRPVVRNTADFSDIDFSDFSFSFIDQLPQEQDIDPLEKKYRLVYNQFESEKSDDLILRYIQSIFTIWNVAGKKPNREIQRYCLYTFINWMTIIDRMNDPEMNYPALLNSFLNNLMSRNYDVLRQENDPIPSASSLFSYNNYLSRIFSDDIFRPNIELYYDALLAHLYQVVVTGKFAYAENFVSRCTDSSWYPSNRGAYSNLHSRLFQKFRDVGIEDPREQLKAIPEFGLYKIAYIRSLKEFEDWSSAFDHFIANKITTVIGVDEEVTKQVDAIKVFAFASYRFNKLRTIVLEILSLCLFKDDTATLKHALEYNQPHDSNAYQVNKDIMPKDLPELLNIVTYKYTMENDLLSYWDGHHGVEYYLNQLLCVLFYRYSPRRYYGDEDVETSVTAFCKFSLSDDPGSVEGLRQQIETLKNYFGAFTKKGKLKDEFFTQEEQINNTLTLFDRIIASCQQVLDTIEKEGDLTEETKENFLNGVLGNYAQYNYLNRLFKRFGHTLDQPPAEVESIGINEMMDRTAFMKNWHIPYYGFIENRGRDLAEQENRMAQFVLGAKQERSVTNEAAVIEKLDTFAGQNVLIILRNLHMDMLVGRNKDFQPSYNHPEQEDPIPGFYQGLYKNLPIFGLYDQLFHKEVMIISSEGMFYSEPEAEAIPPFVVRNGYKTSFIDFSADSQKRNELMANPPQWIEEEFKGDRQALNNYLEKKVWIRIFKKVHYSTSANFKCVVFDLGK